MADLLLAPDEVSAGVHAHLAGCAVCRTELDELRAAMGVLDHWQAPEPDPYFMTRFEARLREEQAGGALNWWQKLRDSLRLANARPVQPLAAMALTVLLLVGGGGYLGLSDWEQPQLPASVQTAVVNDLQTMDSNAQLLDQLEDISENSGN